MAKEQSGAIPGHSTIDHIITSDTLIDCRQLFQYKLYMFSYLSQQLFFYIAHVSLTLSDDLAGKTNFLD